MKKKVISPKFPIDYVYFIIDSNKDGSISIELESNPSTFESLSESVKSKLKYVEQYITYLVMGNFIEVGEYRTMGSLEIKNEEMRLEYNVCKSLNEDPDGDDDWENFNKKYLVG